MTDMEIFRQARAFFEESNAVDQVFKRLPKDTKLSLVLDGRFHGYVVHDGSTTKFLEGAVKGADFELQMSSEALRRMSSNPPGSLGDLFKEFFSQGLRRDVRWKILIPPKSLLDRGYLQSLKDLAPLIQGEVAMTAMLHAGKALAAIEEIKSKFRPKS